MSVSQATIDLIFRAQNLAGSVASDLAGTLSGVGEAGVTAAGRVSGAFAGMGQKLAAGLGQAVESLTTGGDIGTAMLNLGGFMAGELAEQFGGQLIERIAGSGIIALIAAPLSAMGTAMGSLIAAAIPIGMALLPAIIIAAIVGAIALLIANPDIREKVISFVGGLVGKIGEFLQNGLKILGDIIPKAFQAAMELVVNVIKLYVQAFTTVWIDIPKALIGLGGDILRAIIGGLAGFAQAVWKIITDAFQSIHIDVGPFHITGSGVTIDLPQIDFPHFAGGVTNFAGGLAVVGEKGPELVHLPAGSNVYPTGTGPAAGGAGVGVVLQGVTQDELVDAVARGMYFQLRMAGVRG